MDNIKPIEKAALVVHWTTGPVLCCVKHAEKLVALGNFLAAHTPVTPYNGNEDCINCVNEAKNK